MGAISSVCTLVINSAVRLNVCAQIFDFELTSGDMEAINKLNRDLRLVAPTAVRNGWVMPLMRTTMPSWSGPDFLNVHLFASHLWICHLVRWFRWLSRSAHQTRTVSQKELGSIARLASWLLVQISGAHGLRLIPMAGKRVQRCLL